MTVVKNNQKGTSLMEALAVVSVIGVLTISIFNIIASTYDTFKQSMTSSDVKDLQKAISGVYNFSGDYGNLLKEGYEKVLCETDKSIPSHMCIKSGGGYNLRHRLGGKVEIGPGYNTKSYYIKFDGLSKKNCINLTQIDWLDRKKIDIYQMDINSDKVACFPKTNTCGGFPVSSSAFSKCKNKNSIKWYFY